MDYGTVLAVEDLNALIGKEYPTPSGVMVKAECGLIDSSWATYRCYQTCADSGGFFHPSKGSGAAFGGKISQSQIEQFPTIILYSYIDSTLKTQVYITRIKDGKPPIKIPRKVTRDFLKGISGQKLVARKTPTGKAFVWAPKRDDHYGDALKLCVLAWHILRS